MSVCARASLHVCIFVPAFVHVKYFNPQYNLSFIENKIAVLKFFGLFYKSFFQRFSDKVSVKPFNQMVVSVNSEI